MYEFESNVFTPIAISCVLVVVTAKLCDQISKHMSFTESAEDRFEREQLERFREMLELDKESEPDQIEMVWEEGEVIQVGLDEKLISRPRLVMKEIPSYFFNRNANYSEN